MGKSTATTAGPVPSDDSKKSRVEASNVTPIKGRTRAGASAPNAATSAVSEPASTPEPALVVFGRDDSGKAHASWFGAADAELATKAAALMGFKVLPVTSLDVRAKALELAAGRVFASGNGFVPFCKEAAYEALNACEGAYAPAAPPEPQPEPEIVITGPAATWAEIGAGSLVLATQGDDSGWFESVVKEARGDDLFVLRWLGWPHDPEFARRRENLGLLPPAHSDDGNLARPADSAA